MGTETIKTCDVYGRRKDVKNYGLVIADENGEALLDLQVDLCPKAFERAKRLVQKACTPATRKAKA